VRTHVKALRQERHRRDREAPTISTTIIVAVIAMKTSVRRSPGRLSSCPKE
jgi:hypothetical protein